MLDIYSRTNFKIKRKVQHNMEQYIKNNQYRIQGMVYGVLTPLHHHIACPTRNNVMKMYKNTNKYKVETIGKILNYINYINLYYIM